MIEPRFPPYGESDHGERSDDLAGCGGCGRDVSPEAAPTGGVLDGRGVFYCIDCVLAGRGRFTVLDGYVLVRRIGGGGMGEVYLAVERATRRVVAFKIIRDVPCRDAAELAIRFAREAVVLSQLEHSNIVRFLAGGQIDGLPYLVMEFVPGKTLRVVLELKKRLDPSRTIMIGYQVASALDHAFERNIVHRDLKPDNVMIDREGRVRVIDLGLAKPIIALGHDSGITAFGATLGTLPYMAPEQVEDSKFVDQRADIYSLGTILYEATSGQRAFAGETRRELVRRIMEGVFVPLREVGPDLPAGLEAVIVRAMARGPADRFQTPGEMKAALKALAE